MIQDILTKNGIISFPAYIPVTTFGNKYPLDNLVRPYLPRLSQAIMVSAYYAKDITKANRPNMPLMVDSGGFAALFQNSRIKKKDGLGILEVKQENGDIELISPQSVLAFQEDINADIAFSLDFPIPPNTSKNEQGKRFRLTIDNAIWAIQNKRKKDMKLYACLQAWDDRSAKKGASFYNDYPFDGVAIGGLVPRARNIDLVMSIVKAVRSEIPDKPLHVFGLGKPELVEQLFEAGVNSIDSSSYIKLAVDGRLWQSDKRIESPTELERLHLALCNLAYATRTTMPLSTSHLAFSTLNLMKG